MAQAYSLEKLREEPILLLTFDSSFRVNEDLAELLQDLTRMLDQAEEPVFYVSVAKDLSVKFGEMVTGLGMATQGSLAVLRHPNIRKVITVTDASMVQLAVNALRQTQYGGLKVAVFDDLDDALTSIRDELGGEAN